MSMVEVKASELEGAALDWAVAKIQNLEARLYLCPIENKYRVATIVPGGDIEIAWHPSTSWTRGGPLIEKYSVEIIASPLVGVSFNAIVGDEEDYDWQPGETHLIAACRAIVAAKLGDVVSVPSELLEQTK